VKLQRSTAFALYAVLELAAEPDRYFSATEIAEKYGISAHHLAKVLRALADAGILAATRGVGGGYRFVGNAKRLTLMDVIQLFETVGEKETAGGVRAAPTGIARTLRFVLDEIDQLSIATFRSITVSTMLKLVAKKIGA
jgi:Rrf2 family nitric oxide-sensitive transcriptional repressor